MPYKIIILSFFFILFFIKFNHAIEYRSIKEVTTVANLRAGPGSWYPIKWVIKNPGLPLKILEKNESFFSIELHDKTKYWISEDLVSRKHNLIVIKDTLIKNKKGKVMAKILKDVIIKEHSCKDDNSSNLCEVKIDNVKGYIYKNNLWGFN